MRQINAAHNEPIEHCVHSALIFLSQPRERRGRVHLTREQLGDTGDRGVFVRTAVEDGL